MDITPLSEQTSDPRIKWLREKMPDTFGVAYAAVQAVRQAEAENRAQFAKELAARMQAA